LLVLLIAAATVAVLEWQGGALLAALGVGFVGWRHGLMVRLGGTTGDTLGAACELAETITLLTLALLVE
jgi:adenosylcobinamide-GDP ribazoletransferase